MFIVRVRVRANESNILTINFKFFESVAGSSFITNIVSDWKKPSELYGMLFIRNVRDEQYFIQEKTKISYN